MSVEFVDGIQMNTEGRPDHSGAGTTEGPIGDVAGDNPGASFRPPEIGGAPRTNGGIISPIDD